MLSSMLELKDISISMGANTLIEQASAVIAPGERVVLTGPSGSGKSLLLELFLPERKPDGGQVLLDGINISAMPQIALQLYRQRCGRVWQDMKLLLQETVAENVRLPLEALGQYGKTANERVGEVLSELGLSQKAKVVVAELPMSERALVAFARAIVHKPSILIIDDLWSILSPESLENIVRILERESVAGASVLCAARDESIAELLDARLLELRDGRVLADTAHVQAHQIAAQQTQWQGVETTQATTNGTHITPIAIGG